MAGSRRLMLGAAISIPGAQDVGTVGEFTGLHAAEEIEILLDAAVAVGAFLAWFGEVPRLTRISSALWLST